MTAPAISRDETVLAVLHKYWGYDSLRPLQRDAIEAGIAQRDSLVVLPTGGGKSLCYQVPPLVENRTDVVVSPLISLMKDQVDGLQASGYPAAALHSGLSEDERRRVSAEIMAGKHRLVFVSPERVLTPWFLAIAERLDVRAFAIDEAHCISQWGHDFRPEYRRLAMLKERFPKASIHAFTATATPRVREDILRQLNLTDAQVLVGVFDRPNLVYRVVQRRGAEEQIIETLRRHQGESAIVYCISRADTERTAEALNQRGIRASAYHAGLDPRTRSATQEAFATEKVDVVVATVAFGMGIDRSNVRCVIHAAMPKSIEGYQQETGRAGRDGLEAECVLLHSASDYRRWETIIAGRGSEGQPQAVTDAQLGLVKEMQRFAGSMECRHKALSNYFGQEYKGQSCGACDICLDESPDMEGGDDITKRIVACVGRLRGSFGVGYVVDVLAGSKSERIEQRKHNEMQEYGSLKGVARDSIQSAVFQLIEQGVLSRTDGERPLVQLTQTSRDVLEGKQAVRLRAPSAGSARGPDEAGWEGVDRGLFEQLRQLRRTVADEKTVPPFVVFSDATLRDLARTRPASVDTFGGVRGVGERKQVELGERFVALIRGYCKEHMLPVDVRVEARPPLVRRSVAVAGAKADAYRLFDQERTVDEVVAQTGRARSTVSSYLEDYIGDRKPESVTAWVGDGLYKRIIAAAKTSGGSFLRPVFEALDGEVSYDDIRIVMKHAGQR